MRSLENVNGGKHRMLVPFWQCQMCKLHGELLAVTKCFWFLIWWAVSQMNFEHIVLHCFHLKHMHDTGGIEYHLLCCRSTSDWSIRFWKESSKGLDYRLLLYDMHAKEIHGTVGLMTQTDSVLQKEGLSPNLLILYKQNWWLWDGPFSNGATPVRNGWFWWPITR